MSSLHVGLSHDPGRESATADDHGFHQVLRLHRLPLQAFDERSACDQPLANELLMPLGTTDPPLDTFALVAFALLTYQRPEAARIAVFGLRQVAAWTSGAGRRERDSHIDKLGLVEPGIQLG